MAIFSSRAGSVGSPYAQRTDSPVITALTILGWFYFTSDADHQTVFGIGDGTHFAVVVRDTAGAIAISTDGAGGSISGFPLNQWLFIGLTLDGANSNLVVAKASESGFTTAGNAYTGSWVPNSLSLSTSYAPDGSHMYATNMMVFSSKLTNEQMWRQMHKYAPQNPTLWAWWKLQTVETLVKDWSGNGRPLTLTGTFKQAPEAIGFWDYPVDATEGPSSIIQVATRILGFDTGAAALTAILAGAPSEQAVGALSMGALASLAGGASSEQAGAAALVGTLLQPSALLYDAYGAPVVSAAAAMPPAASSHAAGASQMTAALALAGATSEEGAGAASVAGALALAGGLSEERYGASVIAGLLQLSGAATAEVAGAAAILGTLALTGATSEERSGAATVLQTLIMLIASAGDDSRAGASTLAAAVQLAGAISGERPGAAGMSALATLAGALSEEMAGAAQVTANLTTISAGAGGQSGEKAGAATVAAAIALAGAPSGEAAGAAALTAALLMAGVRGEERAGAMTLAATLVLAAGALSEAVGVSTTAATAQLAGVRSEEMAGALSILAKVALAGAPSGEAPGANTFLQTILMSLAGAPSEQRSGAATIAGKLSVPPALSEEVLGAIRTQAVLAMAGALSEEQAGALAVLFLGFVNDPVAFLYGPPSIASLFPSLLSPVLENSRTTVVVTPSAPRGSMADFYIAQNDLLPSLKAILLDTDGKTPIDLTGCDVAFRIQLADGTGTVFGGDCEIVGDPTEGVVQYDWQAGNTAKDGVYRAEWVVTFLDGKMMTWPNSKYVWVEIKPRLAS